MSQFLLPTIMLVNICGWIFAGYFGLAGEVPVKKIFTNPLTITFGCLIILCTWGFALANFALWVFLLVQVVGVLGALGLIRMFGGSTQFISPIFFLLAVSLLIYTV